MRSGESSSILLYIVGWELSPSRIGLPSVNQNQTHIHVLTPTLQPIGFNSLIDSQLEKAEKCGQNCVRCAYATMQVRFGCVCVASVFTYNPQALYFSKKFSPIFFYRRDFRRFFLFCGGCRNLYDQNFIQISLKNQFVTG